MLTIEIIQFWKKTYLYLFCATVPLVFANEVLAGESAANSGSSLLPTFVSNLLIEMNNYYNQLSVTTVVTIMLSVAGIIFLILLFTLYRLHHTVKQQQFEPIPEQQSMTQTTVTETQPLLTVASVQAEQPLLSAPSDEPKTPFQDIQPEPPLLSVPSDEPKTPFQNTQTENGYMAVESNKPAENHSMKLESTEIVSLEMDQVAIERVISQRLVRITIAHKIVRNHSLAAMGIGLVPLPIIDLAAITGVQLRMLYLIAQQYQVPFQRHLVKSLIASLLSGAVTSSTATPLASVLKIVPLLGYASGVISVSVLGGATTYAVGKVFIQHFEFGGTFLDFEPTRMRKYFQDFYEEGKQVAKAQIVEQNPSN
jgi:uncharacterized protein (DUF697 family)